MNQLPSMARRRAMRARSASLREVGLTAARVGRATQAAHSSVALGEVDVPLVEAVENARDTASDLPGVTEEAEVAADDAYVAAINVDEALTAANGAVEEALLAKQTADGKNSIYSQPITPVAHPDRPFKQSDLWYETQVVDGTTRIATVNVWDGAKWAPNALVGNSLLVPGSVGPVLIENGAVTGQKLAFDAIDGKTITGPLIRTAATGERMQFDQFGLRAFNSSNVVTASLAPVNGQMTLNGVIKMPTGGGTPAEIGSYGISSPLFDNKSMNADRTNGFSHQRRDLSSSFGTQFGELIANSESIFLRRRFDTLTGNTRGVFEVRTYDGAAINLVSRATRTSVPTYLDIRPELSSGYYSIGGGPMSAMRFYENRIEVQGRISNSDDIPWGRLDEVIPGAALGPGMIHGVNTLYVGLQACVKAGVLYIGGRLERSGGIPANHVLFSLPPAYRSPVPDPGPAYSSAGHNFVVLQPNGECILALQSNAYVTIYKMPIPLPS